ncbi:MAG: hypothetical protein BWY83_02747 [bacterium ADurb.Bin478]|nr:MAG: hypothetical protein BWY83_02747 [bacterium ADurb.Bin478]
MHFYPWDLRLGFQYRAIAEDKRWIHIRDDYYHFLHARGLRRYHGNEHEGYYENKGAIINRLPWECSVDHFVGQEACRFIREHEQDGLYLPPRLKPESKAFRTYHDQLPYEDGDAPSSNQGYHCGALLAAKELGLEVTDQDIAQAIAGYRRLFNESGGYMATSLMQPEHIGQDALYGETLTFAVFGQKLLTDEMVQRHLRTTMKIQSPYGMRVISKANGDLLDGHSGVYTYGGSWFLNDAANYLDGLIHGMDSKWVDEQLVWRLKKELAFMPAFHESISTVSGRPHGHHLYSWNSGYWWLRREVRKRLGFSGEDPVHARMDKELGVASKGGYLILQPPERPFYSAP